MRRNRTARRRRVHRRLTDADRIALPASAPRRRPDDRQRTAARADRSRWRPPRRCRRPRPPTTSMSDCRCSTRCRRRMVDRIGLVATRRRPVPSTTVEAPDERARGCAATASSDVIEHGEPSMPAASRSARSSHHRRRRRPRSRTVAVAAAVEPHARADAVARRARESVPQLRRTRRRSRGRARNAQSRQRSTPAETPAPSRRRRYVRTTAADRRGHHPRHRPTRGGAIRQRCSPSPSHDSRATPTRGREQRWESMAEEIRMQVLQRIDIFTDTGLREQLGAAPAADRRSRERRAGRRRSTSTSASSLRAYVAEAIEREIEKWRRKGDRA